MKNEYSNPTFLLADYVIICVAISDLALLIGYIAYNWANKNTPSDLTTLIGGLTGGVFMAAGRRSSQKNSNDPNASNKYTEYALMAISTALVAVTVNYALLIWAGNPIPNGTGIFINGLNAVLLADTFFGKHPQVDPENSRTVNTTIDKQ